MNGKLEQIISLIEQHKGDKVLLIAIDGHSAAGKSTLAKKLTASLSSAAIIYMDDFYRVMDRQKRYELTAKEGYECYYDWQRLRQEVLHPISCGDTVRFAVYDWQINQLGDSRELKAENIVIVEGCYSARPELETYYDVIVYVETPAPERERRQFERNDATIEWLKRWDAAERFYIQTTSLPERANIIVNGF